MYSSRITQWWISVVCILLLAGCGTGSAISSNIEVTENSVDTISFEETIRINNCGNLTDSEQTKTRSFSTSIEGTAELNVGYQVIEGSVSGKYGEERTAVTSQRLTAAPNTNMEFVLRWSEKVYAGNVTVNGRIGSYRVRIPITVEQVSSHNLGCPGGDTPITNPTSSATQPLPTNEASQPHSQTDSCPTPGSYSSRSEALKPNLTIMGPASIHSIDGSVELARVLGLEWTPYWGSNVPLGTVVSIPAVIQLNNGVSYEPNGTVFYYVSDDRMYAAEQCWITNHAGQ